jgi:DNA-binding response OmpR family regulator
MKKALVIDDTREIADGICQMLSLLDIQAKAVYSPLSALQTAKDYVPDLVLVDIHMPGLEGVEVISYLRREITFMDVPIVVVTSDDQKETRQEALRAGATEVIIKPISFDVLERVIKSLRW